MATPSGTISLNDVNVELGLAGTTTISMNQASVRSLAGVPSGAISMQNLQNKSNRISRSATISANTANYTVSTDKASGYIAGKTDFTLTINSGVYVYSGSTGTAALIVNTSWAAGDTVTIVNNGTIVGRGGAGGIGGTSFFNGSSENGKVGGGGGLGLLVQRAITLNNLNRISGGGGGGGGSGAFTNPSHTSQGSGGGGGVGNGSSGPRGPGPCSGGVFCAPAGGAGSLTSPGNGGAGLTLGFVTCFAGESSYNYQSARGAGGAGGAFGSPGSTSGPGFSSGPTPCGGTLNGAAGGGGGAGGAISGNSNITYINTGTRNGGIT